MLDEAHSSPFSTKSNFARHFATFVALAASLGWLTTINADRTFGSRWLITPDGLSALRNKAMYLNG